MFIFSSFHFLFIFSSQRRFIFSIILNCENLDCEQAMKKQGQWLLLLFSIRNVLLSWLLFLWFQSSITISFSLQFLFSTAPTKPIFLYYYIIYLFLLFRSNFFFLLSTYVVCHSDSSHNLFYSSIRVFFLNIWLMINIPSIYKRCVCVCVSEYTRKIHATKMSTTNSIFITEET